MAKKKRSWIVTVECVVLKSVVAENCTAEEAKANLWTHSIEETDISMSDWDVKSVEPNE